MVELPCYGEVMDKVKAKVLRLVGQKVLEFQEDQFRAWFGERWQRERDAKSIILCPGCNWSPGFERRGEREAVFQRPGAEPGTLSTDRVLS